MIAGSGSVITDVIQTGFDMPRTSKLRLDFSLRFLLLAVSVVFFGIILGDKFLKVRSSSTSTAFGTTLNGLYGIEDVNRELTSVLAIDGFKQCEPPDGKPRRHGETWFSGEHTGTDICVCCRLNDSYLGADIHVNTCRWIFEGSKRTDEVEKLKARALAAELHAWWHDADLLTTKRPGK